mmetsp:Transcript_47319/g.60785  ORF Transcript_47319/g.60785 Transcript_47319/m.60785 type:complete len:385 (-) Transcript_47319:110-1264(-)
MEQPEERIVVEEMEDDSAHRPPSPIAPPPPDLNGAILPPPIAEYEKHWDPDHEAWYFMATSTGESYWALDGEGDDGLWMEVFDEETNYKYYLHSVTGETQWAEEDESSTSLTVWDELKDPITGEHYYYSNVNHTAQWTPPQWIDYIDSETNTIYYFHLETQAAVWEKPEDFVENAVDDTETYEFGGENGYIAPDASTIVNESVDGNLMPPPPPTTPSTPSTSSTSHIPIHQTNLVEETINNPPPPPNLPSPPAQRVEGAPRPVVSRITPIPPLPSHIEGCAIVPEKRSMERYEEVPVQCSLSKRPRGRQPNVSSSSSSSSSLSPSHDIPPETPVVGGDGGGGFMRNKDGNSMIIEANQDEVSNEFKQDSDEVESDFMDAEDIGS